MRRLGPTLILLSACASEVAAGLDEAQSQEALAALGRAGIAAERAGEGAGKARRYGIEVASREHARAAFVLRAEGLPRIPEKGFADLYGASGMIPSPTEEKARFAKALAGEVATLLERLEAVADATVIVTVPTEDPLAPPDAPRGKATASVLLKLRPGASPAPSDEPSHDDVRKLVAGAVPELSPDQVAVVSERVASSEPAPSLARIGPIQVARSSKGTLVAVLGGACALVMVMAGWVVHSERRVARLRRAPE